MGKHLGKGKEVCLDWVPLPQGLGALKCRESMQHKTSVVCPGLDVPAGLDVAAGLDFEAGLEFAADVENAPGRAGYPW